MLVNNNLHQWKCTELVDTVQRGLEWNTTIGPKDKALGVTTHNTNRYPSKASAQMGVKGQLHHPSILHNTVIYNPMSLLQPTDVELHVVKWTFVEHAWRL